MQPRNLQKTMQALSGLLLLLLTACGSGKATPTVSVEAIYTSAYSTLMAQQATQLALTPPTSMPTQTLVPTLAPPPSPIATLSFVVPTAGGVTTTGGGAGACDSSAFAGDVTIPDNTVIAGGKTFTKTWTLLNNGTCTWNTTYSLQFDSGDQMGGGTVSMPSSVGPGSTVSISVKLTAPTTKGTFKGIWRLHNAGGAAFGDTPWVIIKVGDGPTETPGPSPTPGAATPTARGGFITISGSLTKINNCGHVSIEFSGADSTPDVTLTDISDGCAYSFSVKSGWSGTIAPQKGTSWVFSPASHKFTNQTSSTTWDSTGQ